MADSSSQLVAITTCPVCGGEDLAPLGGRSDGIAVMQCARCRMGFVAERPADLSLLYGDRYFSGDAEGDLGYSEYSDVAAHSLSWAAELVRLLRPAGRVLDVGCADGYLLRRLGGSYEAYGIEVNERLYRRCAASGIRMLGRDIGDAEALRPYAGSFDVVTAIAVLEHVADLRGAVAQARDLLAPGGFLLFETPLVSGRGHSEVWFRSSLEHIYYPTIQGLDYLLRDVFGRPPIGREVEIAGYGSVFVGLAARDAHLHAELAQRFARLLDAPIETLPSRQQRAFRVYFDLVHAAAPAPQTVAAIADLGAGVEEAVLRRLGELWRHDLVRLADLRRRAGAEAAAARSELASTQRRLDAVLASTSWRSTAPLRFVTRALRDAGRRLRPRPATPLWRLLRGVYRALPIGGGARARLLASLRSRGWMGPASASAPFGDQRVASRSLEAWPADRPLVSVVIPCFNYGKVVGEAVDSVFRQTTQDLEILIVEGGSADPESVRAVRELAAPRTQVFFRQERRQVGDNRNFGIARARGKYICCLDADDRLRPTYLEKALFLLETQGYDVVSTAIGCFGGDDKVYGVERYPALDDMLRGNQVATCAVFRRSLWEEAGGFQDAGLGDDYVFEDWRLWVRFAALGARIANLVDEPLFCYRVHPAGLSRQVGSIERQREAVRAANADLLDAEAHRRSEEQRAVLVRVENPLVNLRGRVEPPQARATVLLAVPFLIVGGAERLLSQVVERLRDDDYRVVIVSTVDADPAFGDCTEWFEASTGEIYHLPRFLAPELWRDFVFSLFETKAVDLLWIVGSSYFYDLLPELKVAFPSLKTIDLLFNTEVHAPNNRKHRAHIDLNLVENEEVLDHLRQSGETPDRLRLIESGVDLKTFRPGPKPEEVLRELGIPPDAFVVGFSGRLAEEKSPGTFLDVAARLRDDPRFWFVMTGAGPLAGEVRRRVAALELGPRLQFLGRVEEPRRYLAIYDALLLPSRFDGRPVVVMESLAMGVPVVASRVGALPELVIHGETGFLCEPGAVASFAASVEWLASRPADHQRMKAAARRFAESHLSAERMLAEYERAFADLLATPASAVSSR